jgi:hypothetical protein
LDYDVGYDVTVKGASVVVEADRVRQRGKSYVMRDVEIHHRSMSAIPQRCIPMENGINLLQDIHSGACGHYWYFLTQTERFCKRTEL